LIGSFFTFVRWSAWATSKIPLLLACMYYAALSRPALGPAVILEMLGLILILCLYAAFGYAINGLSDRKVDRLAGKPDKLGEMPEARVQAFFWSVLGAGILVPLAIYRDRPAVLAILAFSYLLAAGYSLRPVRFKERGLLGVAAAALAQRTLPAVLVFAAMQYWDWAAIAICMLSTVIGLRYILIHQILDEAGDRRSGVATVATAYGGDRLRVILERQLLPAEIGLAAVTVALISTSYWVLLPVSLAYLVWLLAQYATQRPGDEGSAFSIETYNKALENYYGLYLPLALAVLLAAEDAAFWSVVAFTLAWRSRLIGREFRNFGTVARRLLRVA
jgi:4-hydroxybenzoate polyprenyltransferase